MDKKKFTIQYGWLIYLGINSLLLLPWCLGWLLGIEFFTRIFWENPSFMILYMLYGLIGVFIQYAILLGVLIYTIYCFVKKRSVPIFVWTLVVCLFNLVLNLCTMDISYFFARQ